jgi:subtilisin-like proprotein convertase family protein
MFVTRFSPSTRPLFYCLAVLAFTGLILVLIHQNVESAVVSAQTHDEQTNAAPEAVFAGTGVGAIPDGGIFTGCGISTSAPLNVSFAVSGITAPLTDVRVSITGTHTYVGDLRVTLIAPSSAASSIVFSRTGAAAGGNGCGEDADFNGTYSFFDTAPASPTWWNAANIPDASTIPNGDYRTSAPGFAVGGGNNTLITPAFAGLSTAQINGTWTLRFEDLTPDDSGSISAASLTLVGSSGVPVPDALGDYDGDGTTDYAVLRNAGGINGQITWWISHNSTGIPRSQAWGIASDTFIPADFDGDGKDDIAVWRPGIQSAFYIIRSQTNTLDTINFGTQSDNPSVVGDYNNDGFDDVAVYRPGATPGAQSFFYVSYGGVLYRQAWGVNGDIPAPGDYDGDGRMDFAIQRGQSGLGVFYIRYTVAQPDTVTTFGLASDIVVPGNYDSDTKTDLAVITTNGSFMRWIYRPSAGGPDVADDWGLVATDYPVPGDYNGDGKADYAVWRPGATAGSLSTFYVMRPVTRHIETRQWGISEDAPVNLTFAHF